jgi:glycine/D-amino acid oxidase-like deaminating enzyme
VNNKKVIDKVEICIIGAGIFGICSGFFLAKRGYKVIIIDRNYISQRASGCCAGTVSLQNDQPPRLLSIARKSIDVWDYFGKIDKNIEYKRCGGFRIAETESEAIKLKEIKKEQKALGLNVEYLETKELLKAASYLSKHLYAANYCELDGFANARTAVGRIAKLAIKEGVKFSLHNQVKQIKIKSNSIVLETSRGIYEAEKLILATGVRMNELLNSLRINIPIDLFINQMMVSAPEKPVIKHMITNVNDNLTIRQLDIGTVVIGGGWQGEGSLVKDEKRLLFSSVTGNSDIAYRTIPSINKFLINRIWSEFDGFTKDRLPAFGKLPGYENIYINGLCYAGFTSGPYLGKLIAELIDEGKTSEDVRCFNPNRFITSK